MTDKEEIERLRACNETLRRIVFEYRARAREVVRSSTDTIATDEWYTPPHVFDALGCRFDMDVASPGGEVTPWIPTDTFIKYDSLTLPWLGFVWMNPPFGGRNGLVPWINKFFHHNNGIALVPDRTSAPWWQKAAALADAILFVSPKLKFIDATGTPGESPAQGTCLLAAGDRAVIGLRNAEFVGLGILMMPPAHPVHSSAEKVPLPHGIEDTPEIRARMQRALAVSSKDHQT
jgi:hypothetical protein